MSDRHVSDFWDKALNDLMDSKAKVTLRSSHTVELDGVCVWTSNYPYSYGHPYDQKLPEVLPRKWEQTYRFNDSDAASL